MTARKWKGDSGSAWEWNKDEEEGEGEDADSWALAHLPGCPGLPIASARPRLASAPGPGPPGASAWDGTWPARQYCTQVLASPGWSTLAIISVRLTSSAPSAAPGRSLTHLRCTHTQSARARGRGRGLLACDVHRAEHYWRVHTGVLSFSLEDGCVIMDRRIPQGSSMLPRTPLVAAHCAAHTSRSSRTYLK